MRKLLLFLLLFFLIICLTATAEVCKGNLLLNTASSTRDMHALYPGTIEISAEKIIITCNKKIFRLFNDFSATPTNQLKIKRNEIKTLEITNEKIVIIPNAELFRRYRNYFCHTYKVRRFFETDGHDMALVFLTLEQEV
ncbi:MAG: hypothetical protein GY757_57020 [bacterium]|nr:hypothetical protein [bacterium]